MSLLSPSFSFHAPFIFPVTNTQRELEEKYFGFLKTFLFKRMWIWAGGRDVCVMLVNTFFSLFYLFFQRGVA